jgi:hypothetical protein
VVSPPRKRVALVGLGTSSRLAAPYDDPAWEIWAMNQEYRWMPRADRWFEIHADYEHDQVRDTDYLAWLRACEIPIYMQAVDPTIPWSVRYPLDAVKRRFPRKYLTSSLALMMAFAIMEGFEEVGFWGIEMNIDQAEYAEQRPCAEYYVGYMDALGITATIPPQSSLCRASHIYGYEKDPHQHMQAMLEILEHNNDGKRAAVAEQQRALALQQARWEGFGEAVTLLTNCNTQLRRGGQPMVI